MWLELLPHFKHAFRTEAISKPCGAFLHGFSVEYVSKVFSFPQPIIRFLAIIANVT
jgi:hypothetical protein